MASSTPLPGSGRPANTGTVTSQLSTPTAMSEEEERQQTRRALVASAVDSIQRFKQSWLSIMILKAGIGLGQVSLCSII